MASIRKRQKGWQAQIRRKNHPSISKTFRFKTDALHWGRQQEARIERGEQAAHGIRYSEMRLSDLLERYGQEVTPKKLSAYKEIYRIGRLLRHSISEIFLSNLRAHHFAQFRDERLEQAGSQTVRHDINLFSHVLKTAKIDWGIPISNPVEEIRKPPISKPRDRRLKPHEEELLLEGCKGSSVSYLRPIIIIALETAMRRGEILAIRWDDINESQRTLRIPVTKNGHPRVIPLSSKALTTLLGTPRGISERVYEVSPNAFRLAWERLRNRVGIEDLHFHDLRHEAISRFFELGLSIPEVALISGHRDPRMLFRYTHLRAEDVANKIHSMQSIGKFD